MMDGAYFASRKTILDFFNNLLHLNLTKIEQTASGAVACQVIDYIYPGSVPLHRVNWEAKSDYEFIHNYKLLQAAFTKNRVQRHVDVPKLIRAKYQDNLEFCQWLKAFFEMTARDRPDYDPAACRSKGKGGKVAKKHFANTAKMHNSKLLPTDRHTAGKAPSTSKSRPNNPTSNGISTSNRRQATSSRVRLSSKENGNSTTTLSSSSSAGGVTTSRKITARSESNNNSGSDSTLKKKNLELAARNAELDIEVNNIGKERDFYFSKLRDIELIMQVHDEHSNSDAKDPSASSDAEQVIEKIFTILYAKSEDDIYVDDDGNIIGVPPPDDDDVMGGAEKSVLQEEDDDDIFGEGGDEVVRGADVAADDEPAAAIDSIHELGVGVADDDDEDDEDLLVDAYWIQSGTII